MQSIIKKIRNSTHIEFEDREAKKTLIGGVMLKFGL